MATSSLPDVHDAAHRLAGSTRGRNALRMLREWFDRDGLTLDYANQEAVCKLLAAAWGPFTGTTRAAIVEALGE